jgi:hypothetical protein
MTPILIALACAPTPVAPNVAGTPPPQTAPVEEEARVAALEAELSGGRETVVTSELAELSDADKAMLEHLLTAGAQIETLYEKQLGSHRYRSALADDLSRQIFDRNAGPWCLARGTAEDPNCSALPAALAPQFSGVYPDEVQKDGFCDRIAVDTPAVMDPFHAGVMRDGVLIAVPYTERWPDDMAAISVSLTSAADAASDTEQALETYLRAAAKAFGDNDWFAADAAWAAMNQRNSSWYIRVGPDETYWDPCNRHAGFHLTLARVNEGGLVWQDKLDPVKQDLEKTLAEMAGPPYEAREVGFDLPEFIDIVVNTGNARKATGATVGQSLPNWGPVADAGGRTVAMTNMGSDPQSVDVKKLTLESLFCDDLMTGWTPDQTPFLVTTVLHEAAHNLGPAQNYKVDGKTDDEIFGGPISSMFEELKAQSAALYFTDWLVQKGVIDAEMAAQMHVVDIAWSLGKIADGMYTPTGSTKAYAQLSAIQMGWLQDAEALNWRGETTAANGTDVGCFDVTKDKLTPAIHGLASEVFRIKGSGDADAAKALKAKYVDDIDDAQKAQRAIIEERMGRYPLASYVYDVKR